MTRPLQHAALILVVVSLLVTLTACDSDGAKFVEGDTLVFEGEVLPEVVSARHDFTVTETGIVEFHLDRLIVTDPETGETGGGGTVGISIGRPNGEACTPSFSNFVRLGERAQVHLQPVNYCLQIFRSSGIPADALVVYTVTAYTRSAAP